MLDWPIEHEAPWTQIQSSFGPRVENGEPDFHRGIDFDGDRGDPILAAAGGEVFRVYAEDDPDSPYDNGGPTVILRHDAPDGLRFKKQNITRFYTFYQHLDELADIDEGDVIEHG